VAKKKFNNRPFAYHQEIELEIAALTNLGAGLGRIPLPGSLAPGTSALELAAHPSPGGWVVMVPFALPGERVRARVFRNHPNYSEADLVEVLAPSPHRVPPRCPLFGRCGGCQYQNLAYAEQLRWKQRQVQELLQHLAGVEFAVAPVIASPRQFGYRSKITPHFAAPRGGALCRPAALGAPPSNGRPGGPSLPDPRDLPIGFLKQGSRYDIVDVPRCDIATDGINARLDQVRAAVRPQILAGGFPRGATLLLREAAEGVVTDHDAVITEEIPLAGAAGAGSRESATPAAWSAATPAAKAARLQLKFLARDFFQNNPSILPAFAAYVRDQAAAGGARFLLDAYCGSGLFALAAAPRFAGVAGVEISETSIAFARENAVANQIANSTFLAGDAAAIFAGIAFPPGETVVVIDPPRKGCDEPFLHQLLAYGPRAVVYVSCDPATQMRDLRRLLAAGYALAAVQPFDLFPQTRHLECVITLRKDAAG